jgi:hypothetical protein
MRAETRRNCLACLGVLLVLLLGAASTAEAASSARIVAVLNAQRASNGIPAGIVENPAWSADCRAHNAYEHVNKAFGHEEIAGKPGYSSAGNLIAQTSVLAQGIYWTSPSGDPYDNAPFHLFDLLNPRIDSTGAADSQGFGCVEIELGTLRAAPGKITAYSYPGNHRGGVAISQRADEQPKTPAQTVGLGTRTTGPNMFVYFDGPWSDGSRAQVTSASLSSASGSVALRWLDNTSSDLLAPTGAILIPVAPLRPGTTYHVRVAGSVSGVLAGSTIEEALTGTCGQEADGVVNCGQPAPTACVEDFASQAALCGLSKAWAVRDDFTFKTAAARHHGAH